MLSEKEYDHISKKIITCIFETVLSRLRHAINTSTHINVVPYFHDDVWWCALCSRNVQCFYDAIKSTSQFSASLCYGLFGTTIWWWWFVHSCGTMHIFPLKAHYIYAMMWAFNTHILLTHAFFLFFASSAIVHFDRQVFCVCTRRRRRDNNKNKQKKCSLSSEISSDFNVKIIQGHV